MCTLQEVVCTFMIISHLIHLGTRNVSDDSFRGSQNTQFMFKNFFAENHAIYEMMWKNTVQPDRPQMTI
jgi:hypothetical protein